MRLEEGRKSDLAGLQLLVRILNLVQVQEEIYECFKAWSSDQFYVFKSTLAVVWSRVREVGCLHWNDGSSLGKR